jgi:phosphoribosylglycinamide formyltransferase-1
MMNIHPSLLPAFPGLDAQAQALEYGVKQSGCTVHFVDEECDHGPIVLQAAVPVLDDDTESSLSARILEQEHRIYAEAVAHYFQNRLSVEGRRVRIRRG